MPRQRGSAGESGRAPVVRFLAESLSRLSKGDLTFRLTEGFADVYRQVRDDFNTTVTRLEDTISAIAASAREAINAAAEISTGTTDLSRRTEPQAASLEQTSAAMEQLSAPVKRNAKDARDANQFTNGTREAADRGCQAIARGRSPRCHASRTVRGIGAARASTAA